MQPSRGSGDGAALACEDGLITLAVRCFGRTLEIRRDRQFTRCLEIDRTLKADDALPFRFNSQNRPANAMNFRRGSEPHLPTRFNQAFPDICPNLLKEQ